VNRIAGPAPELPALHPAGPAAAQGPEESVFLRMSPAHRGMVLAGFAGYVVAVSLLAAFGTGGSALVVFALTVFVVLRVAPLVFWRQQWGWFHPMNFGILVTALELLRNFPMYAWGIEWHRALPEYGRDRLNLLVAAELALWSLGMVAYYAGFFLFPTPGVPRLKSVQPRHLQVRALAVVGFTAIAMAVFLQRQGGLLAHMLSWGTGRHQALAGTGFLAPVFNLAGAACILWLAAQPSAARSPWFWASGVLAVAVQYLYSGSRGTMLYLVIIGLITWMMSARRLVYARVLLAGVAGLVLLGALGDLRRSTFNGKVDWTAVTEVDVGETLDNVTTGELVSRSTTGRASLAVLARVPNEVGLLKGSSYVAALAFPVPRKLWPGKPGLIDGQVGATFFGFPYGIPLQAVGEAYWNFDVAGVFLVFLLFGVFHRWMARFLERAGGSPPAIGFYVAIMWMMGQPTSMGFVGAVLLGIPIVVLWMVFGMVPLPGRGRRPLPAARSVLAPRAP
jgi:hypothetical protein